MNFSRGSKKNRILSFNLTGFVFVFILSFILSSLSVFYTSNAINITKASEKTLYSKTKKSAKKSKHKKVAYLTFDDGPSANTDKVLDILDKYKIKATFFVVGLNKDKKTIKRLKEIVKRGHSIGLHSLTHDYKQIYASLAAFKKDVYAISNFVKKHTGVDSKLYRFPGGSSNGVSKTNMYTIINWLESAGFIYYDWNLGGTDAAWPIPNANKIYNDIAMYSKSDSDKIVLLHDSKGHETSAKALPRIIEKLKKEGYKFSKITEKTKPVHHGVNKKYKR